MNCKTTYKDINKYRMYRERYKTKYRIKTGSGKYSRRSYTEEENKLILNHSMPDRKLSLIIERSVTAIQIQRSRLKSEMKQEHK